MYTVLMWIIGFLIGGVIFIPGFLAVSLLPIGVRFRHFSQQQAPSKLKIAHELTVVVLAGIPFFIAMSTPGPWRWLWIVVVILVALGMSVNRRGGKGFFVIAWGTFRDVIQMATVIACVLAVVTIVFQLLSGTNQTIDVVWSYFVRSNDTPGGIIGRVTKDAGDIFIFGHFTIAFVVQWITFTWEAKQENRSWSLGGLAAVVYLAGAICVLLAISGIAYWYLVVIGVLGIGGLYFAYTGLVPASPDDDNFELYDFLATCVYLGSLLLMMSHFGSKVVAPETYWQWVRSSGSDIATALKAMSAGGAAPAPAVPTVIPTLTPVVQSIVGLFW